MRTEVAIVGAGPAGLVLGHLLHQAGVAVEILERRSRAYVESRVRAGVLEQTTVECLARLGLDRRLRREGLVHSGTKLSVDGVVTRIDFARLAGGRTVTVYGQQEVMRDLFEAAEARGLPIRFDVEDVRLHDLDTEHPAVHFRSDGLARRLDCAAVAGCDGSHGISRAAIPADSSRTFERVYDIGWLGILVDVPPADDELVYCSHERGFALASMRSPTRSRYYLQCDAADRIESWPDDRFWSELCVRLGPDLAATVERGTAFDKSIAPLRSSVTEPMRYGRLFLAGDAAHIVPPTGAKGMNLAVSDVILLAEALTDLVSHGSSRGIDSYSQRALARVWQAERFSWWFTGLMHRLPGVDAFGRRLQRAELAYVTGSLAAQTMLAENYVGLPLDPAGWARQADGAAGPRHEGAE